LSSSGFNKAVWGAVVAFVACVPILAAAQPPGKAVSASKKLDAALRKSAAKDGDLDVIVTVRQGARVGLLKRLEAMGAKGLKEHGIVSAISGRVNSHALQALLADPDVDGVSIDGDVAPNGGPAPDPVVSNLKQMLAIGNWFTGSTVTAAVIDSGIAETADFTGRIVGSFDFTTGLGAPMAAADGYGHGTHVAGLAGSSGSISGGTYGGVAPGLKFLSLRVLDGKGAGKTSNVIAALQFAVANRDRYGIRIINLSLGHPIYESATTDPLVRAVEAAVRAGIVVVAAAGNYGTNLQTGLPGYAGITSPGNAPSAITVGAASGGATVERTDDRVAPYSSRGPSFLDGYAKPDILAPGTGLLSDSVEGSALATAYPGLVYQSAGGKLLKLSGSSMATGVVTGLVAAMMEAHDYGAKERYDALSMKLKKAYVAAPALTPNAIKAMLQYSATPLRDAAGVKYNALTQGSGEVNGIGAITLAYMANTASATGTAWMPATSAVSTFGTTTEAWAQNIVWGTVAVTGAGLMDVNQAAWAQSVTWGAGELANIVWGTADREEDNVVWGSAFDLADVTWAGSVTEGDNIVWGTSTSTWGLNIVWGTSLLGILEGDNIVWGTMVNEGDNIVWGTVSEGDNIVWGTLDYQNIVWGTASKVMGFVLLGVIL
jgi:serine protease AprX